MTTRDWKRIGRRLYPGAFLVWILEQPNDASWSRRAGDSDPLNAFT